MNILFIALTASAAGLGSWFSNLWIERRKRKEMDAELDHLLATASDKTPRYRDKRKKP